MAWLREEDDLTDLTKLARSLLRCHSFAKNGSKERGPVRRGSVIICRGDSDNYRQGGKSNRAFLF